MTSPVFPTAATAALAWARTVFRRCVPLIVVLRGRKMVAHALIADDEARESALAHLVMEARVEIVVVISDLMELYSGCESHGALFLVEGYLARRNAPSRGGRNPAWAGERATSRPGCTAGTVRSLMLKSESGRPSV